MKYILSNIVGPQGYYDQISLNQLDLKLLQEIVFHNSLKTIAEVSAKASLRYKNFKMDDYHLFLNESSEIDHKKLWTKQNRLLTTKDVSIFKETDFYCNLIAAFPGIQISNEEEIYPEEIYWRICRPPLFNGSEDVGPIHADEWFWALGHGKMNPGFQRVKVWISLYNEKSKNGFRYIQGSHLKEYPYIGVHKDGFVKPVIQVSEDALEINSFHSNPGDAIFFHDKLLHGGMGGGLKTRVSLEFTILIPDKLYRHATLGIV